MSEIDWDIVQDRRPRSQLTTSNPTLTNGQLGVELDTGKAKVGPGAWRDLPYEVAYDKARADTLWNARQQDDDSESGGGSGEVPTRHASFTSVGAADNDNPTLSEIQTWAANQSPVVTAEFVYYTGADDPASPATWFWWIDENGRPFISNDPNGGTTDASAIHWNGVGEFISVSGVGEDLAGSETLLAEDAAFAKVKFTITKLLQDCIKDASASGVTLIDASDTVLRTLKRIFAGAGIQIVDSTSRVDVVRKYTGAGKMGFGSDVSGTYGEIDTESWGRDLLNIASLSEMLTLLGTEWERKTGNVIDFKDKFGVFNTDASPSSGTLSLDTEAQLDSLTFGFYDHASEPNWSGMGIEKIGGYWDSSNLNLAVFLNFGESPSVFIVSDAEIPGTSGVVGIRTYTGTTDTLVLADAGKMVRGNNASANTCTVPPNGDIAFPVNSQVIVSCYGAGVMTIAAGSGVTIRSEDGHLSLKQYAQAVLTKVGTDEWMIEGNLHTP